MAQREEAPDPEAAARVRTPTAVRTRAAAAARRHPLLTALLVLVASTLVFALADVTALNARVDRIELDAPAALGTAPSDTWLVIGTDSRESVPDGPDRYGSVAEAGEGSRADVLALIQPGSAEEPTTVLVIPRDLTLGDTIFTEQRLATSYLDGAQNTVDLLCENLGVPAAHLVTVDMAQFAQIVDAIGGVEVDVPEPMRDAYSGLDIATAGPQTLSGIDALALVRSRHTEVLRDGQWVALSEAEGAERRSEDTGLVMSAVLEGVSAMAGDPIGLQRLAWSLTGNSAVDSGTGVLDMVGLLRAVASGGAARTDVVEVPAPTIGDTFIARPTDETYAVLAERGYAPGTCVSAAGK